MPRIVSWLDVCNIEIHQGVDGWPGAHLIFNNLPYWYFIGLLYKTTGIECDIECIRICYTELEFKGPHWLIYKQTVYEKTV